MVESILSLLGLTELLAESLVAEYFFYVLLYDRIIYRQNIFFLCSVYEICIHKFKNAEHKNDSAGK